MKPSGNLIKLVRAYEGCKLNSYQDLASIWTIGFGATRYKDGARVQAGEKITQDLADSMLNDNIQSVAYMVNNYISGVALTQGQFDALCDFGFNLGLGSLKNSTLLKLVKASPNDPAIQDAFLAWNKVRIDGKLVYNDGLHKRRMAEWAMYKS